MLPVRFRLPQNEHFEIMIISKRLKNLKGLPKEPCPGLQLIIKCDEIDSLKGIPPEIDMLSLVKLENTTIRKVLQEVGLVKRLKTPEDYVGPLLSVFNHGIKELRITYKRGPIFQAQDIFNKHLNGDNDVISCKKELIAAGLSEFAKL